MQKHRKLAAIMFTDIVGYTALMSKDENKALHINISNQPDIQGVFLGAKTLKNVDHAIRIYALTKEKSSLISNISNHADKSFIQKHQPSIAVLPFSDMSPEKDQEWFCDGMSEEILNALVNVEELRVVARTSTFAFKGKHEDIREIGRKLNVETVLEGSVRKAGNRLRITAQLINVENGYHFLSERFDRDMEDVFAIQDEISLAIAETLKVKLLQKEKTAIEKHPTEDIEAYNLYLQGRYNYNKGDWEKGLEYCQQAINKDPSFALAYAGIAEGYSRIEKKDEARTAVEKALQIDDTLAEAHTVLAWLNLII